MTYLLHMIKLQNEAYIHDKSIRFMTHLFRLGHTKLHIWSTDSLASE